jgi:fatty-acyl-CoA synthase
MSIGQRFLEVAESDRGALTFHLEDGVVGLRAVDLAERAHCAASRLILEGVQPGDRVGLLGRNRPEWAVWAFATWLAGATLVPIQIPVRVLDRGAFAERTASLIRAASCRRVVVEPGLCPVVDDALAIEWTEPRSSVACSMPVVDVDDAAVIQFTSGSTSAPRGAVVSHGAVLAQMAALRTASGEVTANDVALGWVPFFHDLGLFFFLLHPVLHMEVGHALPTERFAQDPGEWLRLVKEVGATVVDAPQSAWAAALSSTRRRGTALDLESLRIAWFAAESVEPAFVDRLLAMCGNIGLAPEALGSTYGLAEAVLGVAATPYAHGIRILDLDRDILASKGCYAPPSNSSTRLVSSGQPFVGVRVRVVNELDEELPHGEVGEVQVTGASLMTGYLDRSPSEGFAGQWIHTGDVGFLFDGELYVTGRAKDVLIVMGNNYYPEDFEWAAGRVAGVRPGRAVAFTVGQGAHVILLAESKELVPPPDLAREVAVSVGDAIGATPTRVFLVPPGTIEKTTSGKLRRHLARQAYESGTLEGDTVGDGR